MNAKHELVNCGACGHRLTGEEELCPFCGYRLLKMPYTQPPSKSSGDQPAGESMLSDAEGGNGKVVSDTRPASKMKDGINAQPAAKEKKVKNHTPLFIILGVVAVGIIICLFFLFKGNRNAAPSADSEHVTILPDTVTAVQKDFCFCYSTAVAGNKWLLVISDIFELKRTAGNETDIIKKFRNALHTGFPNEYQLFKSVVKKKYPNFDQAQNECDKLVSSYDKKHYRIRRIDL